MAYETSKKKIIELYHRVGHKNRIDQDGNVGQTFRKLPFQLVSWDTAGGDEAGVWYAEPNNYGDEDILGQAPQFNGNTNLINIDDSCKIVELQFVEQAHPFQDYFELD